MAKEYIVYTKWLALALRKQGFKLLGTGINERFPQYDTYIFEESEEEIEPNYIVKAHYTNEEDIFINYYEMSNGTFKLYDETEYLYKKELSGHLPNASAITSFLILTNSENITFDEVANSLFSSDLTTIKNSNCLIVKMDTFYEFYEKEINKKNLQEYIQLSDVNYFVFDEELLVLTCDVNLFNEILEKVSNEGISLKVKYEVNNESFLYYNQNTKKEEDYKIGVILEYFEEIPGFDNCNNCSNCLSEI